MSDILPCKKCGSFAIQSLDHATNLFVVDCFNEFSSETFDCDAAQGPKCQTSYESIDGWNAMQASNRGPANET